MIHGTSPQKGTLGLVVLVTLLGIAPAADTRDAADPNAVRGTNRLQLDAIKARYADDSFSGGPALQAALARLLPRQGADVARSCDTVWKVGMRVTATKDRPSGMPCVTVGDSGTVLSSSASGMILVEWDGKTCGHDGMGNAVLPPYPNHGAARWFVDCREIAASVTSYAGAQAVLDFLGLQQNEQVASYYDGGLGGFGSGPGPAFGTTFSDARTYFTYNGCCSPDSGVIATINGPNMLVNLDAPVASMAFHYSATVTVTFQAYSGPNGTGTLLYSDSLPSNTSGPGGNTYNTWQPRQFSWAQPAASVVFSGNTNYWGLDRLTYSITPPCNAGDCNQDGICDDGQLPGNDCNANSVLDSCELAAGTASDCDGNGRLDSCDIAEGAPDCNGNGKPDSCDIQRGSALDCNGNGIPDSCDIAGGTPDVNQNGIPDGCETDCNGNGIPDDYEVAQGLVPDCNLNGIPDPCDVAGGASDCDSNGIPDSCELTPESDCDGNGTLDRCDIANGAASDCNLNGIRDDCDLANGTAVDCNFNGRPDSCDVADGSSPDCNANGRPDSCDVQDGGDCNGNAVPDSCDIADGTDPDPEGDGIPNSCEPAQGVRMAGPGDVAGGGCRAVGDEIEFTVTVNNPPVVLVAGQFTVKYDASVLEYLGVSGGDAPMTDILVSIHDQPAGSVFWISTIPYGGTGTLADLLVAKVRFRVIADDCDGGVHASMDESNAPVLIANSGGATVSLPLTQPAPFIVDSAGPVLSNVPADISIAADAGLGCAAIRTLVPPTVSDTCGDTLLTFTRGDGQSLDAPWPCGTTIVTWSATDACLRTAVATTSVTVGPFHLLDLRVAYDGTGYAGSMGRCIELALDGADRSVPMTILGGLGTTTIEVPVGSYGCATVDDDLHSLVSAVPVTIEGTRYVVVAAGNAALRNGDVNDDNIVNVGDWGVMVARIGTSQQVDVDCSTEGFHIDFDGDGQATQSDVDFFLANLLRTGATGCGGTLTGTVADAGWMTVAELAAIVGPNASLADVNADGIVDIRDIEMWVAANREARGQD